MTPPDSPPEDTSLTIRQKMLDDLSEKRPLKKLQEEIDTAEDADASKDQDGDGSSGSNAGAADGTASPGETQAKKDGSPDKSVSPPHTHRKPLLKVDDDELDRVADVSQRWKGMCSFAEMIADSDRGAPFVLRGI